MGFFQWPYSHASSISSLPHRHSLTHSLPFPPSSSVVHWVLDAKEDLLNWPFCGFLTKKSCGTIEFPVVIEASLTAEASWRMFFSSSSMQPIQPRSHKHKETLLSFPCCPKAIFLMLPFNACSQYVVSRQRIEFMRENSAESNNCGSSYFVVVHL